MFEHFEVTISALNRKRTVRVYLPKDYENNCERYPVLYMHDGQNILGAIFGNYEQFYDGLHYNLREMFVSTDLQKKGIGSILLKSLENRLIDIGVTTVMLFTSKGNRTSEFYFNNGYSEWESMAMMGRDI